MNVAYLVRLFLRFLPDAAEDLVSSMNLLRDAMADVANDPDERDLKAINRVADCVQRLEEGE